jgi:hypothetical protein
MKMDGQDNEQSPAEEEPRVKKRRENEFESLNFLVWGLE